MNYYSEFDPHAAAWLRELIREDLIPPGEVDERDIRDVKAADLKGFVQCHFFAGIGGWSHALDLAGWPRTPRVWTASCPCPPFSSAGKKKLCPKCGGKPMPHPLKTGIFACIPCGYEWLADERHLWPEFRRLVEESIVAECEPTDIFGEQVAGPDGLVWLAGVRATLEALGYGVGAVDTCAAGVGAPHIRQRIYWHGMAKPERGSVTGGRSDSQSRVVGMGNPDDTGLEGRRERGERAGELPAGAAVPLGFWSDHYWIGCRDGKARRLKPGLEPLVNGVPGRVGLLRGYGNAICPQTAAAFIQACEGELTAGRVH